MNENIKNKMKKWLKPILFTLGGVVFGFIYYYYAGCADGTCAITGSPLSTMAYMGMIGWLLSNVFGKGCGKCNM